jgi:2-polyprenyl-6-methoxyphenol hydroxylase-like FAD-dependent oxidoreductase
VTRQQRAVVVGAGPAGLATAIALRTVGFEPVVYERRAGFGVAGNGLTLWPNGLAALAALGIDGAVRSRALAAPGTSMRSHTGRVLYELSGQAMDAIGGRGVALHRAELLAALAGLLGSDAIRFDMRCTGVRSGQTGAIAVFDDGTEVDADVVVGADGIRSGVRSSCGIPAGLTFGGYAVWRATIPFELPPCPGLMSLGGPNQFGIWRLPGHRVYWFASTPSAPGQHRRGYSRPPDLFADWHQPIGALLAATPTGHITVTDIYDCAPLSAWSVGRVVLVGDAAHPSMPTMGQGTSQAFEDAAVLAGRLAAETGIDCALRSYEAHRRRRARAAWSQARMLARVGSWRGTFACRLRERMLAAVPQRAKLRQLERMFAFPT